MNPPAASRSQTQSVSPYPRPRQLPAHPRRHPERSEGPPHFVFALLCFLLLALTSAQADSGTLLPRDHQSPDPRILSLEEMSVTISIDNGDAHVSITQIFLNHTANIEEGTYRFSLPSSATVSDFAVWDGPVRIPAVILERKRAEQVYDQARLQAIDPGLLELGEREDAGTTGIDPRNTALFTAKIVPIPAYGTKRLELEYHQRLATTNFQQFFALPLKPDANQQQTARHFHLHFILHTAPAIDSLRSPNQAFALARKDDHTADQTFDFADFHFTEDFSAIWHFDSSSQDQLTLLTHHADVPPDHASKADTIAGQIPAEPAFFQATLLLSDTPPAPATQPIPRTLLLLFDTSLSMQWEKLERSYAALEATLHSLKPEDSFNLLLFNQTVTPFRPAPIPATPQAVQQALDFVRASPLRGGTDLARALTAALAQSTANTTLALFTDGGSNRGETVLPAKIAANYSAAWRASKHPPRTAVFAVGDDASITLLRNLAHNGGFLEQVLSTEPVDIHLQSFVARLTRTPVAGLALSAPGAQFVYPLDDDVYPGSAATWVGQFSSTARLEVTATGSRVANGSTKPFSLHATTEKATTDHPQLPRLWAQARVTALLARIDTDGETSAAIDEIIRLSRRYKFVTPYTSFLAVPRSLLRPRVIRPGDPVLRVRTDPAITSVIALFPFGLTKPLRHLASEDRNAPRGQEAEANRLWETRFLAPADMKDGTYTVRLLLRDTAGHTYNEAKTFVIASTPPTVKLQLARDQLHRGETLEIRASASSSTRTLTAHLAGATPVTLRWNARALTNTGTLIIPADLPQGRYTLTVTAEDVAHNLATQEAQIHVLP